MHRAGYRNYSVQFSDRSDVVLLSLAPFLSRSPRLSRFLSEAQAHSLASLLSLTPPHAFPSSRASMLVCWDSVALWRSSRALDRTISLCLPLRVECAG